MWIAASVFIQLIRSSMCRCARTRLGDVSYCGVIFSQNKYFWCILKLRAPPLFSLHPSLLSYFYSLFRLGRVSSFARPWPAFFVLASEFLNPRLRSWYSELTQKPQIKPRIIIVCFSSILRCMFSFCCLYLVYFQQLLFLFQSSLCFFSPVSGLESPLSSISHHPPCCCVTAAMFGSETAVTKLADHLWPTFVRLMSLLTQTSSFFMQWNAVKGGKTGN